MRIDQETGQRLKLWIRRYNHYSCEGTAQIAEKIKQHIQEIINNAIAGGTHVAWKEPDKDRWHVEIENRIGIGDSLLNAYLDALLGSPVYDNSHGFRQIIANPSGKE